MRLAMLLTLAAVCIAQETHQHHPPRSAAEYAKVLESPARDAWQKPDEVVAALGLTGQEIVADLGAGSGYFTRRLAPRAKSVLAIDIDPKLLEITRKNSPANVNAILATADDPKLSPSSVDLIFICDVWHHIDNRPMYLAKLASALRPGGRIAIVDFYKRPLPVGPPPSMKLDPEEVIAEFQSAGLELARKHEFLPHQYFLEFQRKK